MSTDLSELFVTVTGETATTERQEEDPSRDPIDERTASVESVAESAKEDGLRDAVAGADGGDVSSTG